MRHSFFKKLVELADRDRRILLLTGDVGYLLLEQFAGRFPDRYFNAGVAEQNMMGMATGLAEAGYIPFTYSIAPFVVLRPFEFIRNGPVLHRLPVRIVGSGGGFEYGPNGCTHNILGDIGILRTQPGITIVAPADFEQTQSALSATWNLPGPVYYRVGKDEKNTVPGLNGRFEIGRVQITREGGDILFLVTGGIAPEVSNAADILLQKGISSTLAVVSCFNPSPVDDMATLVKRFPVVVSVEAHYATGGLGSLASEVIAEAGALCRLVRCGVRVLPVGLSGSQRYCQERHGLSAPSIAETALAALGKNR